MAEDKIAIVHVNVGLLQRIYDGIDVGRSGTIALFRDDGVLLARRPYQEANVGRNFSNAALFRDQLPQAPSGSYETISGLDGVERIVTFRRVHQSPS